MVGNVGKKGPKTAPAAIDHSFVKGLHVKQWLPVNGERAKTAFFVKKRLTTRFLSKTRLNMRHNGDKMATSNIPFDLEEAKNTGFLIMGTTQTGKSTLAKHLVQQIIDDGSTVYVIDTSKVWLKDAPINNIQEYRDGCNDIEINPTVSTVLDISDLGYERRIKFVNAFTKMIYNHHRNQGHKKAPFAFIFYEEAHTYFPNGCFRSPRRYAPCVDLITVGANYHLRYGAITQFPSALDKMLVKVTQQRFLGRTTEPNDLNYVKNFIGKKWVAEDNPERIQRFGKGQFLYSYNEIQKIQTSPYVEPKPGFTVNGQSVDLKFII